MRIMDDAVEDGVGRSSQFTEDLFSGASSRRDACADAVVFRGCSAAWADLCSLLPSRFRYRCCSGPDGLLVAVSCCAPTPPATGRGRGIGTRDSVGSAVRTAPAS